MQTLTQTSETLQGLGLIFLGHPFQPAPDEGARNDRLASVLCPQGWLVLIRWQARLCWDPRFCHSAIFASVVLQQHICLQHTSTLLFRPQQWEACSSRKTYCPATGVCASLLEVVRMRLRHQHDLREEEDQWKQRSFQTVESVGLKHLRAAVSLFLSIKRFYCLVVEANTFNDPINFKLKSSLHRGE